MATLTPYLTVRPPSAMVLALTLVMPLTSPLRGAVEILDTPHLRLAVQSPSGTYEIVDKSTGVTWKSNPYQQRFGEITLRQDGKSLKHDLLPATIRKDGPALVLNFKPGLAEVGVRIQPAREGKALDFSYKASPETLVESIRLLDEALWTSDVDQGAAVVPAREGLLINAHSGLAFNQGFGTFEYEGCHLEMLGIIKQGATALLTWHDPYVRADVRSATNGLGKLSARQVLSASLSLRKSAHGFQLQFPGRGSHVQLAQAYRAVAREKGWFVPWSEKLKTNPDRARLFGAANAKLWSTLSRTMNEESTQEISQRVNWTFDEAAQVAEHLKNDLKMDRVLFILGGWIHRGYDNQHPDVLPSAPECGGDAAFAEASRRILKLGYVYGLHDNYADMYRDAPSWNEGYLMRSADGQIVKGGKWAGGRAFLTCAQKAVELARRPQNLPAVKRLTGATAYFIDTTYAVGLQECFDPKHPLTRWDDMKWKQTLSDDARAVFGMFGSECGREWAIPHADFFEGLTGVGGRYYHQHSAAPALETRLGATVIPLFELVYHDCIALYGKYGYDPALAGEQVAHHALMGRTMYYHSIPSHLYWKEPGREARPVKMMPSVASVTPTGPRQFTIQYRWEVDEPPAEDWRVFVHFTDPQGNIKFQNDHQPTPALTTWKKGVIEQGPFKVTVPEGMQGIFPVNIGLFQPQKGYPRAPLAGARNEDRSVLTGRLSVNAQGQVSFAPAPFKADGNSEPDPSLYVRADQGWAEGRHHMDCFMKNTYELLSPLHELTAQWPLADHRFLTADQQVQQSTFASGSKSLVVTANKGRRNFSLTSRWLGPMVLPPYGLAIESDTFAAYCLSEWQGKKLTSPAMFTLRCQPGKKLNTDSHLAVFNGFGTAKLDPAQMLKR